MMFSVDTGHARVAAHAESNGASMNAESFDRWARGLRGRLSRRGLGRGIVGAVAGLGVTSADARKKKKKKKKAAATCNAPRVECETACCEAGVPCVGGRCGCDAGHVPCNLSGAGAACVAGTCCPAGACSGGACCPPDLVCGFSDDFTRTVCRCASRPDVCEEVCCPTGQACSDGACGPCQPGLNPWEDQDENGIPRFRWCGAACVCVTSAENGVACVDSTELVELSEASCDCVDDAECSARLQEPALCIQFDGSSETCPSGRACLPAPPCPGL